MYDCQASAAVPSMLIPLPTASLVLKRRSPIVHVSRLVHSSRDSDVKLQGVLVGVAGAGNVVALPGVLVLFVMTGCFIDPSRYPIAPLWFAARRISLRHEAQFVLSNLLFFANVGVDPIDDIVMFCARGAGADNLLSKISQKSPMKVDNYLFTY